MVLSSSGQANQIKNIAKRPHFQQKKDKTVVPIQNFDQSIFDYAKNYQNILNRPNTEEFQNINLSTKNQQFQGSLIQKEKSDENARHQKEQQIQAQQFHSSIHNQNHNSIHNSNHNPNHNLNHNSNQQLLQQQQFIQMHLNQQQQNVVQQDFQQQQQFQTGNQIQTNPHGDQYQAPNVQYNAKKQNDLQKNIRQRRMKNYKEIKKDEEIFLRKVLESQKDNPENQIKQTKKSFLEKFRQIPSKRNLHVPIQEKSSEEQNSLTNIKFESPAIQIAKNQSQYHLDVIPKEKIDEEEVDESIQQESYMTSNNQREKAQNNRFEQYKRESSNSQKNSSSDKQSFKQIINDSEGSGGLGQAYIVQYQQEPTVKSVSFNETDQSYNLLNISQNQPILFEKNIQQDNVYGKIIRWKIGELIGSGTFVQVYKALNLENGNIFAVKKIPISSEKDKYFIKSLKLELKILNELKHPNIVEYFGSETINEIFYIYLEYMNAGDISKILKQYGRLPDDSIKAYAVQILSGLNFMHEQNVIHRDVKGANILVSNDGIVKLSDFGCAKQLMVSMNSISTEKESEEFAKSLKGSVPWIAPEVITESKYSPEADIWSFGCTILEMATAKIPWSQYDFDNPYAVIYLIGSNQDIPYIPQDLSPLLSDFIKICLNREPSLRPSAEMLLKHQFLVQECEIVQEI